MDEEVQQGIPVNPEKVIGRLSQQVGALNVEIAMRDALIEDLQEQISQYQQLLDKTADDIVKEGNSNGKSKREAAAKG